LLGGCKKKEGSGDYEEFEEKNVEGGETSRIKQGLSID
jgi:hypothetical protein